MPAGSTYTPIATTTLGSSQSSITFSSISQSYTDLICVVNGVISATDKSLLVRINGDSGSNYSSTFFYGDGVNVVSARGSNENLFLAGRLGNVQSNSTINFQNYSNTTTYKTMLARGNNTIGLVLANVSLWRSTAAISSIVLSLESAANFNSGTKATIYGIVAA